MRVTFFDHMFDNEYRQRADINMLKEAVLDSPGPNLVAGLQGRLKAVELRAGQLQLVVNTLVEMMVRKEVATREELEVLLMQIDLLDGREDGKVGPVREVTERCDSCQHFLNPQRDHCLYCGRPVALRGHGDGPYRGGAHAKQSDPNARLATCSECEGRVPQQETYFTDEGKLLCVECFQD